MSTEARLADLERRLTKAWAQIDALAADRDALAARLREAVGLLGPVAAQLKWVSDRDADSDFVNVPIEGELRAGTVRRAAAFLAERGE